MRSRGITVAKQISLSLVSTNLPGRRLVLHSEIVHSRQSLTSGFRQKILDRRPLDWPPSWSFSESFCTVFFVWRFPTFPALEPWQAAAAACSLQVYVYLDGKPFSSETISG